MMSISQGWRVVLDMAQKAAMSGHSSGSGMADIPLDALRRRIR
jgi:hypothetical protein